MDQRGQSVPITAAALVLSAVVVLGLASGARHATDAAQARTAADAAALAGAADGRDAAEELARANEGRLVRFERAGRDVLVTVVVGGAHVTARARLEQPI